MDYELMLMDRIAKIQAINKQYDLENNGYIAFSGGLDSVVLSAIVDEALPNNKIPRVYANTGIEYKMIREYVKDRAKNDNRFIILNQKRNIKETLNTYGYPFKSKEYSQRLDEFNKGICKNTTDGFINGGLTANGKTKKTCPKKLLYQFNKKGEFNFSQQCCYKLKKDLMSEFSLSSGRKITITGMRAEEGGSRRNINCVSFKDGKIVRFHPLLVVDSEFEEKYIKENNIKLCDLYYPPYNFKRTGCKGCPYNLKLAQDLKTMKELLPNEYKQCLLIWKPVYKEYIRIGYRLKEDLYGK